MGAGEIGVCGKIVQWLVEVQNKVELGYVTVLLHNMEGLIVLLMDHQILKPKDATKMLAQVSKNHMGRQMLTKTLNMHEKLYKTKKVYDIKKD